MEKQKSSKATLIFTIILILLMLATVAATGWAYSKYTKESKNESTANTTTKNETKETPKNNEIVSHCEHVYNGKIAPGTAGSFDIAINANNTEVDVKYSIIIDGMKLNSQGETIKHLKFFTDEEHTDEIEIGKLNSNLVGIIKAKSNNEEEQNATVKIYWYWPFNYTDASSEANKEVYGSIIEEYRMEAENAGESNVEKYARELYNKEDTKVSEKIETMYIDYTIKAWQVELNNEENNKN